MSDSLIQLPAMASGASFAGTCLMQTRMFMWAPSKSWKRSDERRPLRNGLALPVLLETLRPRRPELQNSAKAGAGSEGGKEGRTYFPAQRLKIRAALVPPKPKEFES